MLKAEKLKWVVAGVAVLLLHGCSPAFAQVRISELPVATNVGTNDQVVLVQSNVTKRAAAGLFGGGGGGTSDFNALTNVPGWLSTNAGTTAGNLGLYESTAAEGLRDAAGIYDTANGQTALTIQDGVVSSSSGTVPGALREFLGLTNVVQADTNEVASAAAWTLTAAPTNFVATISTNQTGIGWDAEGQFTLMTPVGPMTFRTTGTPEEPTFVWMGKIIAQSFDAVEINGKVYANQIEGGALGGVIEDSVMQSSMPAILRNWQASGAAAAGWPHGLTNAALYPTSGTYLPVGVVSNFGVDPIVGRWFSMGELRTNFTTAGGLVTGSAAAGDPVVANGAGGTATVANRTATRVLTNDVSKTNWTTATISASTNVATSPFPSWSIEGGATYHLRYSCWWSSDSTNAGVAFGVVFTNHLTPVPQNVGFGRTFSGSEVGFNSSTNASEMWFNFSVGINGGTQSNRVVSGYMTFYAQSNSTMTFAWAPANNVTNVQTLKAGSTITLEKISP
jgi:hypothetical protein